MLILEKALVLKTVSFFKFMPEETLLAIAETVQEKLFQPGQLIIKEGEIGDEMFVIVSGKVQVHTGSKKITQLHEREVFGELGALTREKRNASVTAIEETLLLNLSHDLLYELIETNSGIAKGIIHLLCQRSRTITGFPPE